MVSTESKIPLSRWLTAATKIQSHEFGAAILSLLFVFILMSSYNMMKPVRDSMASDWSDVEVSFLWTLNFFISLAAVSLYGLAISNMRFRWIVPSVYIAFAASFYFFYAGSSLIPDPVLIDKSFYVWLSVFALFNLSVFWSFMSDLYSKAQAPRLFGFIAIGSSAGAIVGPLMAGATVDIVGDKQLMLIAATMLLLTVPIIFMLERLKNTQLDNANVSADLSRQKLGRNPLAGFSIFLKSPFLLGIACFILLYVAISSFVYFEQKNLLAEFTRMERREILSWVELAVNGLAIFTAMFITSRLATKLGMAATLALLPLLVVIGMLVLAVSPIIAVVLGLQIARRAGNYAITRPAREMLFTVVDREARFKAKPVIDIVFYRGGDMIWAWAFTGLTTGLALGLGAVAAVGAVIAAVWAAVGVYLGRSFDRMSNVEQQDTVRGMKYDESK